MFKTFILGRSSTADMVLDEQSVSRKHMEVTISDRDRFFCIDCASSHGSYVWRGGEWQRLTQGFVTPDEIILLGKKKVHFADVISHLKKNGIEVSFNAENFEPISFRPRRNSTTGEIE